MLSVSKEITKLYFYYNKTNSIEQICISLSDDELNCYYNNPYKVGYLTYLVSNKLLKISNSYDNTANLFMLNEYNELFYCTLYGPSLDDIVIPFTSVSAKLI
jgi:hypothetical protein